MDTAIIVGVGVIMGSVVAIALVFGKTVLGVAWTGNGAKRVTVVESGNKDNIFQQHMQDKNDVITSASNLSKADGKQISSQVEKTKDLESLLNKEVTTCDNVAIGCISALQNGLMFISCTPLNIKYEIPTYFVRQYDQNIVLVDISARDLEHYRPQLSF